jgi:uncharacterized membrane protein
MVILGFFEIDQPIVSYYGHVSLEAWAMTAAGVMALVVGLVLVRTRFRAALGVDRLLVLGPVFAAVPLAMFAMEHFLAASDLVPLVPQWMPWPLFWVYFVGACLMAAAVSFLAWRYVRWSAALLAVFFLLVVVLIDLPHLPRHSHDRLFWTGTVREVCFAGGAMVLAGSLWPRGRAGATLVRIGRFFVAAVFLFYATQHFLFPRFAPGVPLEKMTPDWVSSPAVLAYIVGITLLLAGVGLLFRRTIALAAAGSGIVLLLLTVFFYGPICWLQIDSPLGVDGLNYLGDTLLFAATALLAGFGHEFILGRSQPGAFHPSGSDRAAPPE